MSFDQILFPIDESEHCRALGRQVGWLANLFGSRVTLLHSTNLLRTCYAGTEAYYSSGSFAMFIERARKYLSEFPIDLPPYRVTRAVANGDPGQEIIDWVDRHGTALIVMGTHDCGTLRGFLLGSVAEKVMHHVDCPVWVQSASQQASNVKASGVQQIICALELSEEAVPVLSFTRDFAEKTGAQVVVVHSTPELAGPREAYPNPQYERVMQSARSEVVSIQQMARTDYPVELSGDNITEAVCRAALNLGSDLVIIGRGGCRKALGHFRTHAFEMIRRSCCPVLSCSNPESRRNSRPALERGAAHSN